MSEYSIHQMSSPSLKDNLKDESVLEDLICRGSTFQSEQEPPRTFLNHFIENKVCTSL